jgi:Cu(I)/Ag(I) efflux system membrane fusion protein
MRHIFLAAVLVSLVVSCKNKTANSPAQADAWYTCSMDPQIIEHKPGKCPICHMQLTPVKKSNGQTKDEILLSEQQIQLGNINTDTIRTQSMSDQFVLTATLNFDQAKSTSVSARVMGRVEKLYFKTAGEYIKKGAPLFELYSEDLNNAKQEYLAAVERKKMFSSESAIDFEQLLESAKNKLLLWGMSERQIREMAESKKVLATTTFFSTSAGYITQLDIREGDYVMEGGTIVKLADLSTLWAEAQVYTSQLQDIDRYGETTVQIPGVDSKVIKGKIEFSNPEINPETRINLIRVTIPNRGNQLRPGMPAYVVLKSSHRNTLTLPTDAVIRDSKGATVWLKTGEHSFKNKMVVVGSTSDNLIEIKSGLKAGDVVVVTGAYLLQSEYIFRKGVNPMAGHDMSDM